MEYFQLSTIRAGPLGLIIFLLSSCPLHKAQMTWANAALI